MVHEIESDALFDPELEKAGAKLVVVDFFAKWCGPCRNIAPTVDAYAIKYSNAVFLKVDVDKCEATQAKAGVTAMPTFVFYKNKVKIDDLRGADPAKLEEKIQKHYGDGDVAGGADNGEPVVKGHIDLASMILESGTECGNESEEHPLKHALKAGGGYVESDCDEQLLISLTFTQAVKLHSLKMTAPADNGPKTVKLFINQPGSLDFDTAASRTAVQELVLEAKDLQEDNVIPLKFVKFQNVQSLTIFVNDNQSGAETTQIDHLAIYGSPVAGVTNMNDFKRVAGKKGESE